MFTWHNYTNRKWHGRTLGRIQADILFILHVRSGSFVPLGDMIDFIYPDPDAEPILPENCIASAVMKLRVKFGKNIIENNYTRGYMIGQYHEHS